MQEFIVPRLPDSVKYAFIDSDSIAYQGAFAVQKARYKYMNIHTREETLTFENAKQGKTYLAQEEEKCLLFGFEFNPADWAREKIVVLGSEEEALKAADTALNGWLKHVPGREWKGFFTEKGETKTKDLPGLEKRYQGNRDGVISPVHLMTCRNHLMSRDEMIMVKNGFEADAIVLSRAEKKGKEACVVSLDKDLRQAENTYIIDMSYDPPLITIADNNVGGVWECPLKSDPKKKKYKFNGCGFKWLCLQAVAGDMADHYGGIKGIGARTVISALEGCETYEQCLDAVYAFYDAHGRFKYVSWDGQDMDLSPAEMCLQHFNLAYQERSPTDSFTFEKYNWSVAGYERRKNNG